MGGGDRQQIAASLRDLRQRSGLTTRALAERLGWTQAKVSRTELGNAPLTPEVIASWADATGAPADVRAALMAEAQTRGTRSWKTVHSAGLAASQRAIDAVEAEMTGLRNFQPATVPGLLQTAAYASRVLSLANITGQDDVARAVALRLRRQERLYDPARQFEFIMTEGALRWKAGSAEVMRAQADRLISVMTLVNVTVTVIPFDAEPNALYASGFTIFDLPGESRILVEILTREHRFGSEWDVRMYGELFAKLRETAVTDEAAAGLIRHAMTH